MRATVRNVTFDDELWSAVESYGVQTGQPTAAVIRQACVEFLRSKEIKVEPSPLDGRRRHGLGRKPRLSLWELAHPPAANEKTVMIPSLIAEYLNTRGTVDQLLIRGDQLYRGQGYALRLNATPAEHIRMFEQSMPLSIDPDRLKRRAYRLYEQRLTEAGVID